MNAHAPEPWEIRDCGGISDGVLKDANGKFIYGYSSDEGAFDKDNPDMIRAVKSVNAMAGVADPEEFMAVVRKAVKRHKKGGWPKSGFGSFSGELLDGIEEALLGDDAPEKEVLT